MPIEDLITFLSFYYCPEGKKPKTYKKYLEEFIRDLCANGLTEKLLEIYGDEMAYCYTIFEEYRGVEWKTRF